MKFSEVIELLYNHVHEKTKAPAPLVGDLLYQTVRDNAELIDNYIKHERDFNFEYFGFKTLEKSYLLKCDGELVEVSTPLPLYISLSYYGCCCYDNHTNTAFPPFSL